MPYLVAANALVQFCEGPFSFACTDEALRQILSTRVGAQIYEKVVDNAGRCQMRMDVELGLINRVFLTRAIKTRLVRSQSAEGQTAFGPVAKAPALAAGEAGNKNGRDRSAGDRQRGFRRVRGARANEAGSQFRLMES